MSEMKLQIKWEITVKAKSVRKFLLCSMNALRIAILVKKAFIRLWGLPYLPIWYLLGPTNINSFPSFWRWSQGVWNMPSTYFVILSNLQSDSLQISKLSQPPGAEQFDSLQKNICHTWGASSNNSHTSFIRCGQFERGCNFSPQPQI